jgi:hypothetical protein
MALPERTVELIQAGVDREISAADKRELDSILAGSEDARRYHAEIAELCDALGAADMLDPPAHLHHLIVDSVESNRRRAPRSKAGSSFLAAPAFRLATAFAAGVVLTWSFVSSDNQSRNAFDDVTGLVGTISDRELAAAGTSGISISHANIAGTVTMRKSGRLLVVDFDLVSKGPVDVIAGFANTDLWFNGFAQLESSGTSVAAEPGRVTIRMDGKRRYALYLNDSGSRDAAIDLQFVSSGSVVHEARLAAAVEK